MISAQVVTPSTPDGGGSDFGFALPGYLMRPELGGRCRSGTSFDSLAAHDDSAGETPILIPLDLVVFIVKDSPTIRRAIHGSFRRVAARIGGSFRVLDFPTCESRLQSLDTVLAAGQRSIVTVDHQLAAAGGRLSGTDLITTLVARNYTGVIASLSGDRDSEGGRPPHRRRPHRLRQTPPHR